MHPVFIDALTSPTLKHLRQHWWDDEFTGFLMETLKPRPGNRILDVGCGEGFAEVSIGRRQVSQISLHGVDRRLPRVVSAARETAAHNQRARFAAADAVRLPFRDGAFDSTFCVAVLQHVHDVGMAVAEMARVTRERGLMVAVEPDNSARYAFSSIPAGVAAFEAATEFFAALMSSRAESTEPAIGPKLAGLFASHGVEVLAVRLFPVSYTQIGTPPEEVWTVRRAHVERMMSSESARPELCALARDYVKVLDAYAREARTAGAGFVEIQNRLLFATVGQKQ